MPVQKKAISSLEEMASLFERSKAKKRSQNSEGGIYYGELLNNKYCRIVLCKKKPFKTACNEFFEVRTNSYKGQYYLKANIGNGTRTWESIKHKAGKKGTNLFLHYIVLYLAGFDVPTGHQVHHINIVSMDCTIGNLIVVPGDIHQKFHSDKRFMHGSAIASKENDSPGLLYLNIIYKDWNNQKQTVLEKLSTLKYNKRKLKKITLLLGLIALSGASGTTLKELRCNRKVQKWAESTTKTLLKSMLSDGLVKKIRHGVYSI